MKHRFKKTIALLLIFCCVVSCASAGLLPTLDEIYGVMMPSAEFAFDRAADETKSDEEGKTLIWSEVTPDDYSLFDRYLSASGCVADAGWREEDALIADIKKDEYAITLSYNRKERVMSLYYPKGTRPEKEKGTDEKGKGGVLPEINKILGDLSRQECFEVAIDTLKAQLQNPDAMRIHSYFFMENGSDYVFYIDYYAQEGSKKPTRQTYNVQVNMATGSVSDADGQ